MAPAACTVRHGAYVFHAPSPEVAAAYVFELKRLDGSAACNFVALQNEKEGTMHLEEVLGFPVEFAELVASALGCSPSSPGAALAQVRESLPSSLANEVRKLIRLRGSHAHPVPASRCKRILADVSLALSSAKRSATGTVQGKSASVPPPDHIAALTGSWESVDNPVIEVMRVPCGVFVGFDEQPDNLMRITLNEKGMPSLNNYTMMEYDAGKARWFREKSEHLDAREILWTRRASEPVSRLVGGPFGDPQKKVTFQDGGVME